MEGEVADERKKLKVTKNPAIKESIEKHIEEGNDRIAVLLGLIQSAQNPQEQVQQKCAKAERLRLTVSGLTAQIKESQVAKEAAQAEVDKHDANEARLLALRKQRVEEIATLNEQANEVLVSRLGQELDFSQWLEKDMESKLKVFDDPLFCQEPKVVQKKTEFQAVAVAMRAHMADFDAHMDFLQNFAAEFREKEAAAAKKKSDDVAKEAAEVAKKAEEDSKAEAKNTEDEQKEGRQRSEGSKEGRGREEEGGRRTASSQVDHSPCRTAGQEPR